MRVAGFAFVHAQVAERIDRIVGAFVRRWSLPADVAEDVRQEGLLAAMVRFRSWQPSIHGDFLVYMAAHVRGEMKDWLREQGLCVKVPARDRAVMIRAARAEIPEAEALLKALRDRAELTDDEARAVRQPDGDDQAEAISRRMEDLAGERVEVRLLLEVAKGAGLVDAARALGVSGGGVRGGICVVAPRMIAEGRRAVEGDLELRRLLGLPVAAPAWWLQPARELREEPRFPTLAPRHSVRIASPGRRADRACNPIGCSRRRGVGGMADAPACGRRWRGARLITRRAATFQVRILGTALSWAAPPRAAPS
jgi:RNA polymerase sigma factor (sigma-70 family)